jgi:hypothetical protein
MMPPAVSEEVAMSDDSMPATLRFLLAARRCELQGLEGLALTCELVTWISRLVHALQKERGYSNIYLGRPEERLLHTLNGHSGEAERIEKAVRESLERQDTTFASAADRARLLNRIAYVFYSLDDLPALRRRVREQRVNAAEATLGFTRLIGGLLALVFDAADTALDPELTRALVAMFNFMQGKELAGQERATGVAGFSAGYLSDAQHEQMHLLLEGQQRCFNVFQEYAEGPVLALWDGLQSSEAETQLRRLRDIAAHTSASQPLDASLNELWFDVCTRRIDAMKDIEDQLASELLQRCRQAIARASADLDNHRVLLRRLAATTAASSQPVLFSIQGSTLDSPPQDGVGMHLNRSILDLMHEQSQRLQALSDELKEARSSLSERKRIERAKLLLMNRYQLSEPAAHERLQRSAMDSGKRLVEVADHLLAYAQKQEGRA